MAYNPSNHAVVGKALGPTGDSPTDGRQTFYDTTVTPNKYRAFVSVAEANAYLTLPAQRNPGALVVINTGVSLAACVITGGTNDLYHYKDGKTNGDLVLFSTGVGGAAAFS